MRAVDGHLGRVGKELFLAQLQKWVDFFVEDMF